MIRYILVGGYPWKAADGGKAFVEACMEQAPDPVNILVCLFARDESEWEQAFKDDIARFQAHLGSRRANFILATKDSFASQVADADVIYLRGGFTDQLINTLQTDTSWLQHLDGKTLVGTSAGADAIAAYHYNLDNPRFGRGLGLLPVKVLVHYGSDYGDGSIDWQQVYKALDAYGAPLKMVPLREGQFVVRQSPKPTH